VKAFVITEVGAPEVLVLSEQPRPTLKPDEVLVHNRFIGVNFVDTTDHDRDHVQTKAVLRH
jgi:NADPH:quinone reductase-like Zn-dependent oxidoreductase